MKRSIKSKIAILLAIYELIGLKTMADNKILKYVTTTTLGLSAIIASKYILNFSKTENNNNNNNFKQNKSQNLENKNINMLNSDKTNDEIKSNIKNLDKNLEQNNEFKNKTELYLDNNKNKLNWNEINTEIKINIENPMEHLSDEVKLGDITQVMAHNALCLDGLMPFGFNKCVACQYIGLVEQAKCGVTVFDIRIKKLEENNSNSESLKWVPEHHGIGANIDVLDEIVSLIEYSQKHPETVYTIKLKTNKKNSDFFTDLNNRLKNKMKKELEKVLFIPKDSKKTKKTKITELTLGEIRKTKKNMIILIKNHSFKSVDEIPEEISKYCFINQSESAYSKFDQSTSYNNQALVKAMIKNIGKKQEKCKKSKLFLSSTPAHTLGYGFGITSYFSPLNDAKKNNNDVTSKILDQLYFNRYRLQAYGLNGIKQDEKCIRDILKYSNACIFNIYGKKGFK